MPRIGDHREINLSKVLSRAHRHHIILISPDHPQPLPKPLHHRPMHFVAIKDRPILQTRCEAELVTGMVLCLPPRERTLGRGGEEGTKRRSRRRIQLGRRWERISLTADEGRRWACHLRGRGG